MAQIPWPEIVSLLLVITFIVCVFLCTQVLRRAIEKTERGSITSVSKLVSNINFLRIVTVALTVLAVAILSLLGKTDNGVLAIFSGIAGYVLGGLNKNDEATDDGG